MIIVFLSVLTLASLSSSHPKVASFSFKSFDRFWITCHQMKEELDLIPIEDLRALLGQGEKVLATLSDQKKESGRVATGEGKRKPRDFVPSSSSGRNANKHRHADTFKPSQTKSSEDSFKPVQTPKSEKIIVENAILERPKQGPPPTDIELIPESTTRPTTLPPPSSSTSPPTTPSSELLATADPELLGALGHASPEILAALQVLCYNIFNWSLHSTFQNICRRLHQRT